MTDEALAPTVVTNSRFPWKAWRYFVLPLAMLVAILATIIIFLALPGKPKDSSSTHFQGFIQLPRHGLLSILDYLSLHDGHLYVTNITHGTLVDLALDDTGMAKQGGVSEVDGPGAAHGVALVPSAGVGYITRSKSNRVDVFDLKTLKLLEEIPVSDDPDAILYIPQDHLVYVANGGARLATLIDAEKRAVIGTIPLGGKPEFVALDSRSGLLYQNLEDVDTLAAVNGMGQKVVGRWSLAPCQGPSGMTIDAAGRRLFSVCSGNAMLVVVNLDTHLVIASMKVGPLPDSVVYDPTLHRVYVAGGTGLLTVIKQDDADSYRLLDQIHTHFGAHTLALDSDTSKVYVAYGSLLVHPRIAVFSPVVTSAGQPSVRGTPLKPSSMGISNERD